MDAAQGACGAKNPGGVLIQTPGASAGSTMGVPALRPSFAPPGPTINWAASPFQSSTTSARAGPDQATTNNAATAPALLRRIAILLPPPDAAIHSQRVCHGSPSMRETYRADGPEVVRSF